MESVEIVIAIFVERKRRSGAVEDVGSDVMSVAAKVSAWKLRRGKGKGFTLAVGGVIRIGKFLRFP